MIRPHARPSELPADQSAFAGGAGPVDLLSDVLKTVKLTGVLYFLVEASDPWGVEVPHKSTFANLILPNAQHVVSYEIILDGSGWVCMADAAPEPFGKGDILVFTHGDPYSLLSAPGEKPEFDAPATVAFLQQMAAGRLPFISREGGGGAALTRYLCGYLGCDIFPFNPLLDTLPRFLRISRARVQEPDLLDRLIDLTLDEAEENRPGAGSIRLRLCELMFVEVIRRYLQSLPAEEAGWLAGLRDPVVGRALALLHQEPARTWTVASLARASATSRAVLAERFTTVVGCPPKAYLTLWRMQMAARLMTDSTIKVASVAEAVGYASESAFSRAFKRTLGVPPASWRPGYGRSSRRH